MFLDTAQSDLEDLLRVPAYKLRQVRRWIFARKTSDFDDMNDLPKSLRFQLKERFGSVFGGKELTRYRAEDGTQKLLLEWKDGERTECVLLQDDRNHGTACISTQVGCAMGCRFCASGLDGFVRNLTTGEILEQVLRLNQLERERSGISRLTHIVVMGIGEPTLNLEALLPALDEITSPDGLDLSSRRVNISTVGIPAGIRMLAKKIKQKQYKLAVSLHAPNDELRNEIIPQNTHTSIAEIMSAADEYFGQTGRRVTFEYILIAGVNDQLLHIQQLTALLRTAGVPSVVNIIPFNPVAELPYRTPAGKDVQRFAQQLSANGIQVKIRFRRGDEISAACGQLRRTARRVLIF